ncbi:hypothetical protein [Ornithinimicrobium tianjinense]|uniref:Uncharacterized protein n=1 Tax=Ornithinimicrobium tianjinense TaxID=1195761 RepID=A0A917F1Z2_9MICO|nr:hypothetical protein [Ornithinimicrobium tianjinense]GGF42050.1 hypothetical protein GCM10011366_07260 [Ornithinimicrobium tianjinense]
MIEKAAVGMFNWHSTAWAGYYLNSPTEIDFSNWRSENTQVKYKTVNLYDTQKRLIDASSNVYVSRSTLDYITFWK